MCRRQAERVHADRTSTGAPGRVALWRRTREIAAVRGRARHWPGRQRSQEVLLGKHFSLTAADKFQLGAYRADPAGPAKGGIVVIQEIFGVNHHIRAVCDRLAGEGYAAVAPALFDRSRRISNAATRPTRSPMRASSSPIRTGARCCATRRPRSTSSRSVARSPSSASAWAAPSRFSRPCRLNGLSAAVCLLRRPDRQDRRREAEGPDADAFRREGRVDPDDRRRDHQAEARRRQRDLRLPGRRATASIATSAAASTRRAPRLAWQRTMDFLKKHLKK